MDSENNWVNPNNIFSVHSSVFSELKLKIYQKYIYFFLLFKKKGERCLD